MVEQQDNTKLKTFHEGLVKANYDVPDYVSFEQTLQDPSKAKTFYDGLIKANYELPDYDTFVSDLGLKKKDLYETLGFGRDLIKEVFGESSSPKVDTEVSKKPSPSELGNFKFTEPKDVISKALKTTPPESPDLSTPDLTIKTPEPKDYPQSTIDDVITRTIIEPKEPEDPITFSNYLTALPQGFNMRMGEAIRNIGAVTNLPKEAMAKGVEKIAGKKDSINEQYLRQAFSAIPILGAFSKENMDELATVIEKAGNPKDIPNDLIGKTLASTGSILFDILNVRMAPTTKLNLLGKYGMERVPMFPTYLATMGGATTARQGGNLKETAKATAEGGIAGLTYEGMGIAAGRVGQLVKELGGKEVLSSASKALANGVMFGADSKVKGGTFAEGAAMGLIFGGYDIGMDAINRSVAHRSYISYLTTTDNAIKTISRMQVDPKDMRKQSDDLWTLSEKETDPVKKQEFLDEKTTIDNIINVNAVTQEIIKNPKAFTDAIAKDEKLSPKEKQVWINKINTTIKDADPRIAEAEPIVADIKNKEGELQYWQEDQSNDPMIKESKIESVTTQIEEQKKALGNTLSKPLDDYAPKPEKKSEKAPKETQTENIGRVREIEKIAKDEGYEFETEADLDPDFSTLTVYDSGKNSIELDKLPKGIKELADEYIQLIQKDRVSTDNELVIGDKTFADKTEMFKHLEEVAVNKKTGELDKTWFDREIDAWPTPETVKAINEWTEGKKAEIKAKQEAQPIEEGVVRVAPKELDKNGLLDEIRKYNELSASQKKKNASQANNIRINAQNLGFELKENVGGMKLTQEGKPEEVKAESQKLEDAWRNELNKNGASKKSEALRQKLTDFNKANFEVEINHVEGIDHMSKMPYSYGEIDYSKISGWADQSPFFDVSTGGRFVPNELGKKVGIRFSDGGGSAFLNFKYTPENAKLVADALNKNGYKTNEKPNEGDTPVSKGKESDLPGGTENDIKPVEAKGEEKPVRTTDPAKQKQIEAIDKEYDGKITDKQTELNAIPDQIDRAVKKANERNGLFGDTTPIGKDEIIKREEQGFSVSLDAVRKPFEERQAQLTKEIDALNKERESKIGEVLKQQTLGFEERTKTEPTPYGKAIQELRGAQEAKLQELLDNAPKLRDAFKITTAKELIDLFRHGSEWKKSGKNSIKSRSTGMQEIDMFIKDKNTTPETRALMKELKDYYQNQNKGWGLNIKDFESKVETPVKETPKSELYQKAEKIVSESTAGRKFSEMNDLINKSNDYEGLKSLLELPYIKKDMDLPKEVQSRLRYLERHPEVAEVKAEPTKEGIKFKDKTYIDIEQVQDDFAEGKLTLDEQRDLLEKVRRFENKRNGIEPLTDNPEELAWDQPLPLSPAEDPNFKNSDLNNAMSLRNVARNFIKNLGFIEGADVRVGMITRFSRRARAIFNPTSGIIRVRNIRDLRALTHEFGHLIDFEIFDIRGIISARTADKQLGAGVDFNGDSYSNVAQVEKAMKNHTITIDEGNYLLEKVKTFEKKKLTEKYSEIVEQGAIIPVKYKNKTYKSDKEINDALTKGIIPTKKASELIVKLNINNKGRSQKLDKLRARFGDDVVAGVLQRVEMKKEFDALLRDVGYPSNKREEGIAEFVYNYVIDPKQLINSTPTTLAWFEKMLDSAPEIKNALHKLREEFAEYDAQDIRTKVVAETKTPPEEKTPWLDGIVKIKDNLLYSWVNQLQHMKNLATEWEQIVGNNALSYKNPYISAKEIIGIDGRAQQWLLFHPYFRKGNEIVINDKVKGLMQIVKPLIGTKDYESYKAYLVALDSRESHNRNKPEQAYLDKNTANAAIAAFEKQYGVQKLWQFQQDIQQYNESLLDFATEAGRISKETADYWKKEHQYYVPLKRIAETYEIMGGKRKTITRDMLPESERAIFSRKGSSKQIKDIFESMIDNTYKILASSERNLLNRNIADAFKDIHEYNRKNNKGGAVIEEIDARGMEAYQDPTTGEIRYAIAKIRPKNFRPPKGRVLTVFEEGVPRFYDVAPEYFDPIYQTTMQATAMMQKIIKVATAPSRWLQAGAVIYDPTFPIRNIVRDQQSAWFYSKHGYLPTDFAKGLFSAIKKDSYYQKWLASGGDQSFLVSADMMMSEDYASHKIGKLTRRKFDAYKKNPLLALQDFSRASEIGTRLGAFRNAYKKTGNVHLAAIESRDVSADYGIKGAMIRNIVQFYPFLNPRIQHARMTTEAMKNPASFMAKGMALTIPAVLNWLLNNQDEESKRLYQSLPTWRRVGLYNIRIPGTDHFLPLPKGFFGVLFASSVESVLDAALKDDPRILTELPAQLFKEISPLGNITEVVPFPVRPVVEMWANKKGYTGKPIISESMKLLKPSEQYYNSTPEIIKKLGEALNWSPVKIEHYFKSYTGGAGIGAVNILDETLQAIGLVDKKPEDTFTMLSRMPVFKALLTEKPIGLSSGYISDFYETLDKIEQVNVTFNNFVKTENMDGLEKFMSDPENKRMYSFYEGNSTALNSFRSALTFARDSMYAVMKDETLSREQKQAEVQRINEVIQESALKFKDAYEKKEFFNYGKTMDDIVIKMKDEKKDYRNELAQQQQTYNPYWMQLRTHNKDVYERLREFGGLRDIDQTREFLTTEGKKIDLELEDVRLFNETVVKRYGENVKNMIGTDKSMYETYQKTTTPTTDNPEMTQLKQLLDSAWEMAMAQTKSDFQPQKLNRVE